jgi:hypothetical protein
LKANHSALEADKPPVGDGDSVCVPGKVFENVLGAAKRWFGIDDPLPFAQGCDPIVELHRVLEFAEFSVELEASLPESLF